MDAIEKRARELLAAQCRRHGFEFGAYQILEGSNLPPFGAASLNAIITALTPPEGSVLVPGKMTEPMLDVMWRAEDDMKDSDIQSLWAELIAARPEVPNVND